MQWREAQASIAVRPLRLLHRANALQRLFQPPRRLEVARALRSNYLLSPIRAWRRQRESVVALRHGGHTAMASDLTIVLPLGATAIFQMGLTGGTSIGGRRLAPLLVFPLRCWRCPPASGLRASIPRRWCIPRSTSPGNSAGRERTRQAILGIRGTGWFLSPRLMVTAAHVAEAMRLSAQDWKEIEIRERSSRTAIPARIFRLAGSQAEKLAVLELRSNLQSRHPSGQDGAAGPRGAPCQSWRTPTACCGLPAGALPIRHRRSRCRHGAMEMHDGNDRLVLDHGASGAPVLDCQGRVVAVVSTLITQTIALPTGACASRRRGTRPTCSQFLPRR